MSRLRRRRPVEHPGYATPCEQANDSAWPDAVRAAESIVYAERWRVYEEQAAARLSETRRVRWTRLFPNSPVVVVVAVDGVVVGRVRRSGKHWVVVLLDHTGPAATRRTRRGAITELVRRAPRPSRIPGWRLWRRVLDC